MNEIINIWMPTAVAFLIAFGIIALIGYSFFKLIPKAKELRELKEK